MAQRSIRARLLVLPLLLVAVGLGGCKPQNLVSQSQEVSIGREAAYDIERQYPVSRDPQLNALVNDIGQYMAARSDRPNLQYTFKVLDIKDVNAVSLPGGWIYVYRGLIDMLGGPNNVNQDMLAGVIAHEVAHVAARHHAEMMGRSTLYGIGISVLTSGSTQQWVGFFANLNLLHYSRGDEYQADRLGMKYTYGSRYNPEGIIGFLQMLQAQHKSNRSGVAAWFATHPNTPDRIERAQTYLNQLRAGL